MNAQQIALLMGPELNRIETWWNRLYVGSSSVDAEIPWEEVERTNSRLESWLHQAANIRALNRARAARLGSLSGDADERHRFQQSINDIDNHFQRLVPVLQELVWKSVQIMWRVDPLAPSKLLGHFLESAQYTAELRDVVREIQVRPNDYIGPPGPKPQLDVLALATVLTALVGALLAKQFLRR